MGRPSLYTPEIADIICERLSADNSLVDICEAEDLPSRTTVYRWMDEHPDFGTRCARARKAQADYLLDDMAGIERKTIAGEIDAAAARAVLSSKQWRASKLDKERYGDKLDLNHSGAVVNLSQEQLDAKIAMMQSKLAQSDGGS